MTWDWVRAQGTEQETLLLETVLVGTHPDYCGWVSPGGCAWGIWPLELYPGRQSCRRYRFSLSSPLYRWDSSANVNKSTAVYALKSIYVPNNLLFRSKLKLSQAKSMNFALKNS